MSDEKDDNRKLPVKPATPVKRRRGVDDEDDLKRDDLKSGGPGLTAKILLVLLTLALLIPSALSRNPFSSDLGRGHVVGTVGSEKKPVYSSDQGNAADTWQMIQNLGYEVDADQSGFVTLDRLLDPEVGQFVKEHPGDGFWLLREWAASVVPSPSSERVSAIVNGDVSSIPGLSNVGSMGTLKIRTRSGLATAAADNASVVGAVHDLLLVRQAIDAEAELGAPSLAMIENAQSRMYRQVTGRVVEVDSRDFLAQVPTDVSDDAVKAQLAKYADVDPTLPPSAASPLGFGYRYPNRVKLQAIIVRFNDVREVVRTQKLKENAKAWELAAVRLYKDRPELFTIEIESTTKPATQPGSDATSKPASQPTSAPAKRLQAFEEVRQKAIDLAIDAETRRRITGPREQGDPLPPVQERLQQLLRDDFKSWTLAGAKPDDTMMSEAHLAAVAQKVQQQYGFLPSTISLQDRFFSTRDLDAHEKLGKFATPFTRRGVMPRSIGEYALQEVRPFVPARMLTRLGDQVLDIGEPSDALVAAAESAGAAPSSSSFNDDVAIIRVVATDAARAAKAEDLTADPKLRETIVRDVRNEKAMSLARNEAESIRRSAQANGNRLDGVTGARAILADQTLSAFESTYTFAGGRPQAALVASTQWGPDLVAKLLAPNPAPLVVLDKPGEMKVCVVEFASTKVLGPSDAVSLAYERNATARRLASAAATGQLSSFFPAAATAESAASSPPYLQIYDVDELRARIGFKASEK
jgi:hypothetical protein